MRNLFSSPHSIPQVRQSFGEGGGAGFHPPARIGSFCQECLGPKEKSCGGWVEKAWALFYAKKQHNGVSAAKGCSAKFCICIVSTAASPAAHRGETNTWKQQHLNWLLKNSETAWKSKAQTKGKWSSSGNSSLVWVCAFPQAPHMSLVAPGEAEPVYVIAAPYKWIQRCFQKIPWLSSFHPSAINLQLSQT